MKVIVNGLLLSNRFSGVHFSILETLLALQQHPIENLEFEVLTGKQADPELVSGPGFRYTPIHLDTSNRFKRIFWEQLMLPLTIKRSPGSIFHSPAYILPRKCPLPSVLTVHDLIALQFPALCRTQTQLYFRSMLPASVKRANKIVAVSEQVKNDIVHRLGIADEKIEVIHHGIGRQFRPMPVDDHIKAKYGINGRYILFTGVLEPKKNIPALLKAFAQLIKDPNIPHQLVIAGIKGWKYNSIFETVKKLRLGNRICFTGFVPAKDLPVLYSMAELFVFPSLYEGFGMPVLEAMACGCPVVTSTAGALPEIAGAAALLCDPVNTGQLAEHMKTLLTDAGTRAEYIRKGFEQSAKFSWDKTALSYIKVYKELGAQYQLI